MSNKPQTKDDIRKVPCPVCGAAPNKGCRFEGKGAFKKMTQGQNHFERMQKAQQELIDRSPREDRPRVERQARIRQRNHYDKEAKDKALPVCPKCGKEATERPSRYGLRAECCDLWSYHRYPLVDKHTHKARQEAHKSFDALWRDPDPAFVGVSRSVFYRMLAEELGIAVDQCHMKLMDCETAERVPAACVVLREKALKIPF